MKSSWSIVSGQWSVVRSQDRPIRSSGLRLAGYKLPTFSAFTLIEIMVVCAIIGIVMTMAIPSIYRRLNPDSIQKAVTDVMEACNEARQQAILQSAPMELVIRAEAGQQTSLTVQPASGGSRGEMGAKPSLDESTPVASGGSIFTARLSDKIAIELMEVNFQDQMEFEEARVRFNANGTSDEFNLVLFRPESQERRLISLEVVTALADVDVIK